MLTEQPTVPVLFAREVVQPLYLFILFSLIAWGIDDYLIYCAVIFATTLIGIVINLYETYQTNKKIHEMAYYETDVNVLRQD